MTYPTTQTKIVEVFKTVLFKEENFLKLLSTGDFQGFEMNLLASFQKIYDYTVSFLVNKVSAREAFKKTMREYGRSKGVKKLSIRKNSLQIATGTYISFPGYYAEQVSADYRGERSMSHVYWGSIEKASPVYVSRSTQLSVITPSFAIAKDVMRNFDCKSQTERNRKLCLSTGKKALLDRVKNMLFEGESLAGKRVLIGTDGGRTRTRVWKTTTDSDYGEFDTPWKEPKLLVISIIGNDGKMDKKELPIYDVCFGDDELFALLSDYLSAMEVEKATSVQFVGDGAPWIWLRAKPMLLNLGVNEANITETLDYYHALEHLNDLAQYLPNDVQDKTMKVLKDLLWQGDIPQMKTVLAQILPDLDTKPLKPFIYFEKNQHRMQYKYFEEKKLPVGSGIVESGIRRVINLRFKCPSSFWNLDNLQPLFYLRAAFLGGRWNNLMNNLVLN